jgi:HlyD family secretion protein
MMKRSMSRSLSALALILIGAGILFLGQLHGQLDAIVAAESTVQTAGSLAQTIPVSATPVSAVGTIELISKRQVVLLTGGTIDEVAVEVGDTVKTGDLLIALQTQQLEWAVDQANIELENARLTLQQASEAVDESDINLAEATLLSAQENLALVEAGPTKEQLDAAKSGAAGAWAAYEELKAGPTQPQLTQLSAALKQAEITLQQAQREYDRIAWQPDAGSSSEGAALQSATIAYEAAKAEYDELVAPPTVSELQSALATAQTAQDELNQLQKKPTPAELASARAEVATADAALAELNKGQDTEDIRMAELGVQSAQIALEQAKLDVSNARVLSPINGVVLAVNVEVGAQGTAGDVIAEIADVGKLRLVVNVEQKDIAQVQVGQAAEISVYGLSGQVYHGIVDKIAPRGESGTGSITFPVTLRLTDETLTNLKPGMNATAVFVIDQEARANTNG